MKKNRRLTIAAVLAIFMVMLWGCGKESVSNESGSGYVYVPEYVDMDIECNYINSVAAVGDNIFLNTVSWDEDTGESTNALYKYDMMEGKGEVLTTALDENSNIGGMTAGPDGELLMVVNSYTYEEDENGEVTDYSQRWEMWKVSAGDGSVMESKEIGGIFDDPENAYVQSFCVDGQIVGSCE